MIENYVKSKEVLLRYERKEDTKGSFYQVTGKGVFINRFSFSKDVFKHPIRTGRAIVFTAVGQIKGGFTKSECSPYKAPIKEPRISATLWKCDNPLVFGFADVGYAYNDEGKIQSSGDLIVISSPDNCQSIIEVRIYPKCYEDTALREKILKSIR